MGTSKKRSRSYRPRGRDVWVIVGYSVGQGPKLGSRYWTRRRSTGPRADCVSSARSEGDERQARALRAHPWFEQADEAHRCTSVGENLNQIVMELVGSHPSDSCQVYITTRLPHELLA